MTDEGKTGNGSGNVWVIAAGGRSDSVVAVFATEHAAQAYIAEHNRDDWVAQPWGFEMPAAGKFTLIQPDDAPTDDDIPEHVKEFNHYARLAREGFDVPPGPWGYPKPQPQPKPKRWWRR